jgi:hypothetical protein
MFLFDYIDPFVFFIALGIGIFLVYILNPIQKIVHKYPTLENAGKTTYLDDEGVCYKYHTEEVSKPNNESVNV